MKMLRATILLLLIIFIPVTGLLAGPIEIFEGDSDLIALSERQLRDEELSEIAGQGNEPTPPEEIKITEARIRLWDEARDGTVTIT